MLALVKVTTDCGTFVQYSFRIHNARRRMDALAKQDKL